MKGYTIENAFLEGVRLYLLGITHNHYCAYNFAVEHLKKSVEVLKNLDDEIFLTYSISALVLALGNQRNLKDMAIYVDQMKSYAPRSDHSRLLMIHSEVVFLVISDNLLEASTLLKNTLSGSLENLNMFKPSFLVLLFSIAFKNKNYEECNKILEDYKLVSGFTVKINYLYMKCLLDHIVAKKPLYIYENDYKDFPEMYHQLEVIKALSVGDTERAKKYWFFLLKHNPSVYKEDFEYGGDYSLFSCSLELYADHSKPDELNLEELNQLTSPIAKLQYILSKSHAPVSKADLIQLIWDEESSEATQNRLRQLIYSYKKKFNQNVISNQDTYKLDKAS